MFEKLSKDYRNLLLVILSLTVFNLFIVLLWFRFSDFLVYTDTNFPLLNLDQYLSRIFSISDIAYFPSVLDFRHLFFYTYAAPFFSFSGFWSLGLASFLERVFLFGVLCLSSVSMVCFLLTIGRIVKRHFSYLSIFITSLLYVFSIYAAIIVWRPFMPYMLHYAMFPLFVAFCLRYYMFRDYRSFLVLMGLSFLFFASYAVLPSLIFDFLFVSFLFVVLSRNLSFRGIVRSIGESVKVFIGILILLVPILVILALEPSLTNTQYNFIAQATQPNGQLLTTISFNSARLLPALFYSGYNGLYSGDFGWYLHYSAMFEPVLLVFFTLFLTIGLVVALRAKTGSNLWFGLVALWLVSLVLFTGTNEPFSSLKIWFFQLKFVDLLRSVFARFGEYVILSSLPFICLGISKTLSFRRSNVIKGLISMLMISVLLVSLYPIFSGDFLSNQSNVVPSNRVVVPASYDFLSSLNSDNTSDFVYLTIPMSVDVSSRLWVNGTEGYIGPDIFPFILSGQAIRDPLIQSSVLDYLVKGKISEIQQVIPLRYVIITFDQLSNSEQFALENYHSIFERKLNLLYEDNTMAVFELPITNSGLSFWPIVAPSSYNSDILDDLLTRQLTCIIYRDTIVDATATTHNYVFKEFSFDDLDYLSTNSTVKFTSASDVFPIHIYFPDNSVVYLRSSFDDSLGAYRIYAGSYSSNMSQSTESLLQVIYSSDVSFCADFSSRTLSIAADSVSNFSMPVSWQDLLSQTYAVSAKVQIGFLSFASLSDASNIAEFSVTKSSNFNYSWPESSVAITNYKQVGAMSFQATLNVAEPTVLVLFEPYAPGWVAVIDGKEVSGQALFDRFVLFNLDEIGSYDFKVFYKPQELFNVAIYLSVFSLFILLILVILFSRKKTVPLSFFKKFSIRERGVG